MNWKSFFWVGLWISLCTVAMMGIIMQISSTINNKTQDLIIANQTTILRKLEEKTVDRYHGADARRDKEALRKEIEAVRKECRCVK